MTILITGIHGFVGANLVSCLKTSHTIYGVDIIAPQKEGVVKTFSWDDLGALCAMPLPEVDVIIHLAGKAHDTKNKSNAETYFKINTGLTHRIFDYFLQSKARQFIFFSSVKAAADRVVETGHAPSLLTEDVIPKPVGPYGQSKIAAENYIQAQVHLTPFAFGPKSVYILRPCMIHGPGNKGNLNLLYNIVSKGIPWPLGAYENKRSFMNIWNLSYIVEQFILKNPPSGIYHLADDEPLSTNELIELIAESRNKKPKILKLDKTFITTLARWGNTLKLPLNSERLQKLTENYVVSNQKMKTALGIRQLPVDVRTGIKQTLETFK
ncbi:nucleoside-diphosphate-sugar epimerase [Bacteroidia bacterium]|nr:nucleoside-diphosphate-sugar epimerase [Bacteroidia bacterium]